LLLERAGLARLRGDRSGAMRGSAEARHLLAETDVNGWNDYVRSLWS
jgi:hypothetical protein